MQNQEKEILEKEMLKNESEFNLESVLNGLKEVEKKYDFSGYFDSKTEMPEFNQKDYMAPGSDIIENEAKKSLDEYLRQNKETIEKDYASKSVKYDGVEESLAKQLNNSKEKLSEEVDKAKENTSNNALKRGLARSSIVVNNMAAFDNVKLKEIANMEQNFSSQIAKINSEKQLLESQKASALNSFDIAYAVKLTDKIAQLNSLEEKKKLEIDKYNEDIQKQEKTFVENSEKEKLQKMEKYVDMKKSGKLDVINGLRGEDMASVILEATKNMSRFDTLDLLKNESIKKALGDSYINVWAKVSIDKVNK